MYRNYFASLIFLFACAASPLGHTEEYHLGQGLPIDNFLLSGYANLVAEAPSGNAASASVDDLSLFVSGQVNRWINPFIETEISSLTVAQQGGITGSNGSFILERFFNDARLSDTNTLRIGKMLSPVGNWNLIHAAPLVPTITRPLTTFLGYNAYISGISWLHENVLDGGLSWQLYWQPDRELGERPNSISSRHYNNTSGAHVNWSPNLSDMIGASFQQGQLIETGESYSVYGANLRNSFEQLTLESEATTSTWSGNVPRAHDNETGVYALADYAFTPIWHGLMEWERFQNHLVAQPSRNTLFGFAYKPDSSLVWKLEYVNQMGVSTDIPTGWLASFSVLF